MPIPALCALSCIREIEQLYWVLGLVFSGALLAACCCEDTQKLLKKPAHPASR